MDRRVIPALVAGLGGLAAGAAGSVLGTRVLSGLAGAGAFLATWSALPLLRKLQRLERPAGASQEGLVDRTTGLPDDRYFTLALMARMRTARRRLSPVALVVVKIEFEPEGNGGAQGRDSGAAAAVLVREAREADDVCCLAPGMYALLLDDASDVEAAAAVTRVQAALASEVAANSISAGVAIYPTHGLEADEIHAQALDALRRARGQNDGRVRVEVAPLETA